MDQVLQWLGGGLLLLNKIFFSRAERARKRHQEKLAQEWRIAAWAACLGGITPWVILFFREKNWIAAAMEVGGTPSVLMGLIIAVRGEEKKPPRWLNLLAQACIAVGLGYSLYDFGGLTTPSQGLELVLVAGFLVGTYLLAKEDPRGYLWYVPMHLACGWLMWIQDYPWLALQQAASLLFVADAYWMARQSKE